MLRNVQAIRAIAALLVVFEHLSLERSDPGARTLFSPFYHLGNFGVDLFFVISGFIMVATNWDAFGKANAGRVFLMRRFIRIYPPYWLVLVPIIAIMFISPREFMHAHQGNTNVLASILLAPQSTAPLLGPSWTLTFELLFYFVFAAVLMARRKLLVPILLGWLTLQLIFSVIWRAEADPYLALLKQPLPIEFILGAFIGVLYKERRIRAVVLVGLFGLCSVLVLWFACLAPEPIVDFDSANIMRVVFFGIPAACIVYAAVGLEALGRRTAPKQMVTLGDASYSLYLWHLPVIAFLRVVLVRFHAHGIVADSIVQTLTLIFTVGLSLFLYRRFERPVTSYLNMKIRGKSVDVGGESTDAKKIE